VPPDPSRPSARPAAAARWNPVAVVLNDRGQALLLSRAPWPRPLPDRVALEPDGDSLWVRVAGGILFGEAAGRALAFVVGAGAVFLGEIDPDHGRAVGLRAVGVDVAARPPRPGGGGEAGG